MKKILFDTSVVIDYLRREDKETSTFYQLSQEKIYISILTHTELFAGKHIREREKERFLLEEVFLGVIIVPLERNISEKAGYIRAYKQSPSLIDSIIAATAIEMGCQLVTLNRKDFIHIQGISLYEK